MSGLSLPGGDTVLNFSSWISGPGISVDKGVGWHLAMTASPRISHQSLGYETAHRERETCCLHDQRHPLQRKNHDCVSVEQANLEGPVLSGKRWVLG